MDTRHGSENVKALQRIPRAGGGIQIGRRYPETSFLFQMTSPADKLGLIEAPD